MDSQQLEAWERRTLEHGLAAVLVESDRLRQLGIIDDAGRLFTDRLPDDMRPEPSNDGVRRWPGRRG
jgi:hypothetical protein